MTDIMLVQVCSMILTKLGFESETFASLLEKWRFFISECDEGYQWDYSEYKNEIHARYLIQQLLNNEQIAGSNEFKHLFVELESLDQKFQSLLQPKILLDKGDGWWDKGVLTKAGDDYRNYMYDAHSITVMSVGD